MSEDKKVHNESDSVDQQGNSNTDKPSLSRRKTINTLVISGGIATVDKWGKPIVDSVVTPVHATTSIDGDGDGGTGMTSPTPPPTSASASPLATPSATPLATPSATPITTPSATPIAASPSVTPSPSASVSATPFSTQR